MSALIPAELLRLRTLRSPRYGALGVLAFLALTAALNVQPTEIQAHPADLADSLRSLALVGALMAALFAATNVATHFHSGAAAMTYLSHPHRGRVGASQALTYAALGALFAAATAAVVLTVGEAIAGADRFHASYSTLEVARMVGGSAAGGAIMGAAGVFIGTVARNPTLASGVLPAWYIAELTLVPEAVQPYLPFGLVDWLMSGSGYLSLPAAIGLLVTYWVALTLVAVKWALPRDLT
jgi:ABC-2 type transport system permease protein